MVRGFLILFLAISFNTKIFSQINLSYQLPPQSIVDLVDGTVPEVLFSNDGRHMLILSSPGFQKMEFLAQPVIGIAGLKFNPANNSVEAERMGVHNGISVKEVSTGLVSEISGLPHYLNATNIRWNPDGRYFAFTNRLNDAIELWIVGIENFSAKKIYDGRVNDAWGTAYQWHPDGNHILLQSVSENKGKAPVESMVPSGPIVQENLGVRTPSRTYQYLLQNSFDEELMDHYLTSQLIEVSTDGDTRKIFVPSIFRSSAYSPDGNYILIQTVERPYSYLVPVYFFPYKTVVTDRDGKMIGELNHAPLADKIPISFDAVADGPRMYHWRSDVPSTIVWVEAQDGGNPNYETDIHDAMFSLNAPFSGTPEKIFSMSKRFGNVSWGNGWGIVRESWRKDRTFRLTLFNPGTGQVIKELLSGSSEQTYTDPGKFVSKSNNSESNLLLLDKGKNPVVFTTSTGPSPEGDRPFLLRWDLLKDKKDTLFKSAPPFYEEPVFFNNTGVIYFSRESAELPPNYVSIRIKNKKETELTAFSDPYPGLKGVQKSLLSYTRKDGLRLSATLYLPAGYNKEDGPLPALIWAYPREYKSAAAAAQVKGSPYRFPILAFRSPVYWVTRGYAVLDDADMPIVGEGKNEPNDTFLEQLESNAVALIDHVADMGVVDRKRVGIGGHSYGAFMTANLLAHTNLFAAGIARSGAYNRTLTPFGFQAESRTYWQAPEVYYKMSPFSYADKIKTPLLITHGVDDDNSGTFPIQSERLYSAIKGFGGTVRLVMLPKEFHGYRSRESVLHTFWEQDRWLEKYVKNRE